MTRVNNKFFDKNFWLSEAGFYYTKPYLRLEKCARLVNRLARNSELELLDVGCGPATLAKFLNPNIHYYGIDIAIHTPGDNFQEVDITHQPIGFKDKKFDLVVATGLFEYMGAFQPQKLFEIQQILKKTGKFIVSFTNFNHINALTEYLPYNNTMSIADFQKDVARYFQIERMAPIFYNLKGTEPRRKWSYQIQKYVTFNLPVISAWFAVSYFFVCSPKV